MATNVIAFPVARVKRNLPVAANDNEFPKTPVVAALRRAA